MTRILSIDYGKKRIGLAVCDPSQIIASPLALIPTKSTHAQTAKAIQDTINEKGFSIEKVIIGDPKLLSGQQSELGKIILMFIEELKKLLNCDIILFDERLTSKESEQLLREAKVKRKKRSQFVDMMSATLILQSYLSMISMVV